MASPTKSVQRVRWLTPDDEEWISDRMAPRCMHCAAVFNRLRRRRHHCRACGWAICAQCSFRVVTGKTTSVLVCVNCHQKNRRPAPPTALAITAPPPGTKAKDISGTTFLASAGVRGEGLEGASTTAVDITTAHSPASSGWVDQGPAAPSPLAMQPAAYSASRPAKFEASSASIASLGTPLLELVVPRRTLRLNAKQPADTWLGLGLRFEAVFAAGDVDEKTPARTWRGSFATDDAYPAVNLPSTAATTVAVGTSAVLDLDLSQCARQQVTAIAFPAGTLGASLREAVLQEAQTMHRLSHASLVQVLGVCLEPELIVVTERVQRGSLRSLVRGLRSVASGTDVTLSAMDLFAAAHQIASAVTWLHSHDIVLGTIACSDIAVIERRPLQVRLADLGHSRAQPDSPRTHAWCAGETLDRSRWLAPEALPDGDFAGTQRLKRTQSGDVFSFGVFLWELFTLGELPYAGISIAALGNYLRSSARLPPPSLFGDQMAEPLRRLWLLEPHRRPAMDTVKGWLHDVEVHALKGAPQRHDWLECRAAKMEMTVARPVPRIEDCGDWRIHRAWGRESDVRALQKAFFTDVPSGGGGGDGSSGGGGGSGGKDGGGESAASAALCTRKIVALRGGVGSGKRQCAREYVHVYGTIANYPAGILWFDASSRSALRRSLCDWVARELHVRDSSWAGAVGRVHAWLCEKSGWLIIFASLNEPSVLYEFLPPPEAKGHILVTSRAGKTQLMTVGASHIHQIGSMPVDAATALLWSRVHHRRTFVSGDDALADLHVRIGDRDADADAGIAELDWIIGPKGINALPVAATLVAGYLGAGSSPSPEVLGQYRAALMKNHPTLLPVNPGGDTELLAEFLLTRGPRALLTRGLNPDQNPNQTPTGDLGALLSKADIRRVADLQEITESQMLDLGWGAERRTAFTSMTEVLPEFLVNAVLERNILRSIWAIALEDWRTRLPTSAVLAQALALLGEGPLPDEFVQDWASASASASRRDGYGVLAALCAESTNARTATSADSNSAAAATGSSSGGGGGGGDGGGDGGGGGVSGGADSGSTTAAADAAAAQGVATALRALCKAGVLQSTSLSLPMGKAAVTFPPGLRPVVYRSTVRWPAAQRARLLGDAALSMAVRLPPLRTEDDLVGDFAELSWLAPHLLALCRHRLDEALEQLTPEAYRRSAAMALAQTLVVVGSNPMLTALATDQEREACLKRARELYRAYGSGVAAKNGGCGDNLKSGFVHIALRRKAAARGDYIAAFGHAKRVMAVFGVESAAQETRLAAIAQYGVTLALAGQGKRGYDEALRALDLFEKAHNSSEKCAATNDGACSDRGSGGDGDSELQNITAVAAAAPEAPATLLLAAGRTANAIGRTEEALGYLERAVDAAPSESLLHMQCVTHMAETLLSLDSIDRARRVLTRLVSAWRGVFTTASEPTQWEAVTASDKVTFAHAGATLGALYIARGEMARAFPFVRQAAVLETERPLFFQPAARSAMARIALARGDTSAAQAQARTVIQQVGACRLYPVRARAALRVAADVLEKTGCNEEAAGAYAIGASA